MSYAYQEIVEKTVLEDHDLKLVTPLELSMAKDIAKGANDPLISKMIGSHTFPFPYTEEDAVFFIEMNRMDGKTPFTIDFAIYFKDRFAGIVGLKDINNTDRKAHVGYWISREFRNMGIASSSLRLVIDYSRDSLHLHRLYTGAFTDNPASIRVLTRCGFQVEGIARDDMIIDGNYRDMMQFGLILQ